MNYLLAATRYIELNPVRAGLVKRPEKYLWSSAKAHMTGRDNELVTVKPLLKLIDDWGKFLSSGYKDEEGALFRRHEQTGRPLGSNLFIKRLGNKLSRNLTPQKGGRPKKQKQGGEGGALKFLSYYPNSDNHFFSLSECLCIESRYPFGK